MAQQLAKMKSRIKSLEEQLFEKNEELQRYHLMGNAADEKIAALGKIHNDKIRSLMNSIQTLKKENAQLENQGKEHKRSKLIAQLNRDIDDQDTAIEVLRNYIYKKEGKEIGRATCDGIIVAALTKGPERIRALSREELRMEIDRLKNEVLLLRRKLKDPNVAVPEGAQQAAETFGLEKSLASEQSSFENANEQLLRNLQDLKAENEALRLQLKSNKKVVESLSSDIRSNNRLEVELSTLQSDLAVAQKKVDTLETLLRQTKDTNNAKIIQLYEREIKVEELELQSKQTTTKLSLLQQNHGLQLEQLTLEKDKLAADLEALTKQNERLILEGVASKKRQEEQKHKINEIRDINSKQKDELAVKLAKYEQEIARILRESDQRADRIATLQLQSKQDQERFSQQKLKLVAELDDLSKAGATKEEIARLKQKESQLEEEIRKFKQVIEAGTVRDSSTGSDMLLMRIKSYEQKIATLEGLLKKQGKVTEKQLQGLNTNEWQQRYQKLAAEFERHKMDNRTPLEPAKRPGKHAELIEVDKEQKNRLDNMSSGMSNMGLESIDGRILNNYDSDFEYSLHEIDRRRKGVPVPTEADKELMKLINSDLWDFIREDRLASKLDQFAEECDSNYEMLDLEDDSEWKKQIQELEELQSKMKRGPRVELYESQKGKVLDMSLSVSEVEGEARNADLKGYDSDININFKALNITRIQDNSQKPLGIRAQELGRIQNISSQLPSSVEDLNVSRPASGESRINIADRRKAPKQKGIQNIKEGSRLPALLEGRDSDYEGMQQARLKLEQMNSDVSADSSIRSNALRMMDSDVSIRFKKK